MNSIVASFQNILLLGGLGNPMASLQKQKKRYFSSARDGGLQHAEQCFGFRDIKDFDPSSDVVFVSIDLEYRKEQNLAPHLLENSASQLPTLDI